MKLHRFHDETKDEHALSTERGGMNLPGGGDRWTYVGEWLAGDGSESFLGHDLPEVVKEVEVHGYSIRPGKSQK